MLAFATSAIAKHDDLSHLTAIRIILAGCAFGLIWLAAVVENSKSGEDLQDRTKSSGREYPWLNASLEDPYGTEDAKEVAGVIEEAASGKTK